MFGVLTSTQVPPKTPNYCAMFPPSTPLITKLTEPEPFPWFLHFNMQKNETMQTIVKQMIAMIANAIVHGLERCFSNGWVFSTVRLRKTVGFLMIGSEKFFIGDVFIFKWTGIKSPTSALIGMGKSSTKVSPTLTAKFGLFCTKVHLCPLRRAKTFP